jgi:tetratricopeptide (TPR) repeat protein
MKMVKEIYSQTKKINIGAGATAKVTEITNCYQVVEEHENEVTLQLLDIDDEPAGSTIAVPRDEFLREYVHRPDYLKKEKKARAIKVERHVRTGDRHYEQNEFFSAEFEYGKALSLDQNHLRANLGKGKTLFALGEKEEAKRVFSRLSKLDALYEKENKHIFNEEGIELRQKGLYAEAIMNYRKAIAIDPHDEVLFFNLARAFFEQGDHREAVDYLKTALGIKPDFKEAVVFLDSIPRVSLPEPLACQIRDGL